MAFSSFGIVIFFVATAVLISTCSGMYSRHINFALASTTTPRSSQPIIKKLTSSEMGSSSQDLVEKSRSKCGGQDNCFTYFLFGCLCYPSDTTGHFTASGGVNPREMSPAELRAMGFVSTPIEDKQWRSRVACMNLCRGRQPCICPYR